MISFHPFHPGKLFDTPTMSAAPIAEDVRSTPYVFPTTLVSHTFRACPGPVDEENATVDEIDAADTAMVVLGCHHHDALDRTLCWLAHEQSYEWSDSEMEWLTALVIGAHRATLSEIYIERENVRNQEVQRTPKCAPCSVPLRDELCYVAKRFLHKRALEVIAMRKTQGTLVPLCQDCQQAHPGGDWILCWSCADENTFTAVAPVDRLAAYAGMFARREMDRMHARRDRTQEQARA
jgi:hypothetical protein